MRNSRYKYTAMIAVLLLACAPATRSAAKWSGDDLAPEIGPTTTPVKQKSLQEPAARAATPLATTEAQLKRIIEGTQSKMDQLRTAAGFPGATVGFVLPDGRSGSVSTGVSDLATKRPLVPTDLLLAGSIGKTFVAAVMIQLAQESQVNLDERIGRWFKAKPWFLHLPNANDITVRMLLNHTSGIAHHPEEEKFLKALAANPDRRWKPEEIVALVLNKKPPFAAGKGFSYSDTNYILAGMVIERVTGATLYSEVTRRFLKPLKLDHIIPQEGRIIPGVANGYSQFTMLAGPGGAMIVDGKFTINPQVEWAGGGFASTAEDLARWARSLYGGELIKQPYKDQMLTGTNTGEVAGYGLGVEIGDGRWGKTHGHDGLFPGYVSDMAYFPQYQLALAIQVNTDREKQLGKDLSAYLDDVMKIIVGELTGKKFEEPQERKAVAVDPKIFDNYAGEYEVAPGVVLTISRDGERLMAQVTGQDRAEIYPSSETEFFSRRVDAQIKFVKNQQGEVTSIVIVQNGQNIPARKIK
jgi:D-alanyl-D-alanine carboxypeptidase